MANLAGKMGPYLARSGLPARDCSLSSRARKKKYVERTKTNFLISLNVGEGVAKSGRRHSKQKHKWLSRSLCLKHRWISLPALEIKSHSWFKAKCFCNIINPLLTMLFRSRWLDISLVLFFFCNLFGPRLRLGPQKSLVDDIFVWKKLASYVREIRKSKTR